MRVKEPLDVVRLRGPLGCGIASPQESNCLPEQRRSEVLIDFRYARVGGVAGTVPGGHRRTVGEAALCTAGPRARTSAFAKRPRKGRCVLSLRAKRPGVWPSIASMSTLCEEQELDRTRLVSRQRRAQHRALLRRHSVDGADASDRGPALGRGWTRCDWRVPACGGGSEEEEELVPSAQDPLGRRRPVPARGHRLGSRWRKQHGHGRHGRHDDHRKSGTCRNAGCCPEQGTRRDQGTCARPEQGTCGVRADLQPEERDQVRGELPVLLTLQPRRTHRPVLGRR